MKERPAESSWRRGPAEISDGRQAEPYKPPKEAKWRNNRSEKYSSRPEADDVERRDRDDRERREVDERRDREDRRDQDWRTSKDTDRSREIRQDRGGRDFAALRDPARKNMDIDRLPQFRDEEKPRRDEREIRRAAPPLASRDGESNWRASRGTVERPPDRGDRDRQLRSDREELSGRSSRPVTDRDERDRPMIRSNDREREKIKSK